MEIIEGGLPEGKRWRALVLIRQGSDVGTAVRFGDALSRAHSGELVLVSLVPSSAESQVTSAREALEQARDIVRNDTASYSLIIATNDPRATVQEIIDQSDIDMVVLAEDQLNVFRPDRFSCSVATVFDRGTKNPEPEPAEEDNGAVFKRILVPSSAGPNTQHALRLLLPLANRSEITAIYIAQSDLGATQEALGRSRLRQVLNFVDASERIDSKVTYARTVTGGILDESQENYDLIVMGATRKGSFDRVLFGNIPARVSQRSQKPVIVIHQNPGRVHDVLSAIAWRLGNIVPRLQLSERTQIYIRVRRGARPNIDFFILIGLSTLIASLGLMLNSPAVVIGAMLVAPLMSPIIGVGMALVLGDVRFLRLALESVVRGVLLAIVLAAITALVRIDQSLTAEVLARTQPNLLDLGVALFAGMAGAYAICKSDAAAALPGVAISAALVPPLASVGIAFTNAAQREALGALLLFSTNFVAISVAAAFVFLVLGFRPNPGQKERQAVQLRSARVAAALLALVTMLLVFSTLPLARETRLQSQVQEVTNQGVREITHAILVDMEQVGGINSPELKLALTVQSTRPVPHRDVVALQDYIGTQLQRRVGLTVRVILVTELDPVVPPTQTPTPIVTATETPGPTPTATATSTTTPTATPSPTLTAAATATPSATATSTSTPTPAPTDTPTQTPSPTPVTAVVNYIYGLNLRAAPGADSALRGFLANGTVVVVLDGRATVEGAEWQEVAVGDLTGWVLADFLEP